MYNTRGKSSDAKKLLDHAEEGEGSVPVPPPPKTRAFLNLLKEFNLSSSLFFNGKSEQEVEQDPEFLENGEEGSERQALLALAGESVGVEARNEMLTSMAAAASKGRGKLGNQREQ